MSEVESTVSGEESIRPLVASRSSNWGLWLFAGALVLGGVYLFVRLEQRRETLVTPTVSVVADRSAGFIAAPPGLDIPPAYDADIYGRSVPPYPAIGPGSGVRSLVPSGSASSPRVSSGPAESYSPPAGTAALPPPPPYSQDAVAAQQSYVSRTELRPPLDPSASESSERTNSKERVEATRFDNPATTVPKGTVIQAVLETALDSNRAGFARAVVSRDVLGFDGSKVLIPRGSRIIGEYKADIEAGQNRVLVQWQRLMRPDGILIELDSPSADPLGRAGIRGKVNTHFFQRFSGAILQSALDVGVQLATREVSRDSIYIGLPGVSQIVAPQPEKIRPTVTIRQGSSVSVFVARDLDFTKVGP